METLTVELGLPGVQVAPGDHVCAFFRGARGRDEILVPYLKSGLASGDKCIAVLDRAESDTVRRELGLAADEAAWDQLDLLRSEETYLRGGSFSIPAMLDFWSETVDGSLGPDGYSFARCLGEMTWALRQMPGVAELVDYESELNRFLPLFPQVIICLYDLDLFDGQVVTDLLRTHPKLLLCGSVVDNPYYLEPDEYLARRTAGSS